MADETINMEVKSNIGDVTKDTDKLTKSTKQATISFGGMLKTIGKLNIVTKIFDIFKKLLGENQVVVDAMATAMNFLSIAFSDFFKFIQSNIEPITSYFKNIFEDPIQSIKDFGQAILDNIIERINSFIETLDFLGKALLKLFKGDFKGALEDVKEAGKEFVDTLTGVDGSVDKITEVVKKGVSALSEYAQTTFKAAEAQTELDKAVNKTASSLEALNIEFDKQAEKQQRIIDNERTSFEDKKAALEELTRLTEENNEANVKAQELLVKQAQGQFTRNESDENFIKLQEEKNKLASIEAGNINKISALSDKDRDITEKNTQAKLSAFSSLAGSLSSLAGDNKELAAAGAIIDTYAGANKAFAQGGVAGFATGAAIVLAGLANVQKIYSTPTGDGGGGGGGTITAAATPAPQMMSGAFELSGGTEPEAFRAYVVTDEMTNSQNQLANIRRRATI